MVLNPTYREEAMFRSYAANRDMGLTAERLQPYFVDAHILEARYQCERRPVEAHRGCF